VAAALVQVQHSASETDFNLERVIPMAQRLSLAAQRAPILARLNWRFDSARLMRGIEACNREGLPKVDWLIKWNPRSKRWTTSLPESLGAQRIIALYADHATHEQFHAEFKTDLDLTRLPSGKFSTNYLACQFAALAMDILRLMGQRGLLGPDAPVRHSAKRRRINSVMQELVYRAGRLIESGRRLILELGANGRAAKAFARLHGELFAACP